MVTESMLVLADPTTCGILSSELTNCPRTETVLGEQAAQWQQMMATLQRVEQEICVIPELGQRHREQEPDTKRCDRRPTARDGERLSPKSWSGSTPIGGFAREAAWLGYVEPKQEAGKLIQRITKGTLRETEAWTDGRHGTDDKNAELDYELAVALANETEGAASSTILKVFQVEPSHGFAAWQALVDKSSNDPAMALQPILATPKRCKDAKELKEKFTAWSLKVAEYEHQLKAIDEAQKTFVVKEMMPKDIRRKFLTGPRKFDEIMEKLEIIVNEMVADDWATSACTTAMCHRMIRMRATTCHTKKCVPLRGKCTRLAREQAGKDRPGRGHGIVEKELMSGRAGREMTEARKVPRAANQNGTETRTREALGAKGKARARARVRPDTATIAESKDTSG